MGCCLFASVLAGAPRLAFLLYWLIKPVQVQAALNSFWVALLGFLFLPWTTLAYVFVFPGGVTWFDWLIVGVAVLIDISTYTGGGVANKRRAQ
jgi:hypothetical protein